MRSFEATAPPSGVEVHCTLQLYVTTLKARGYKPSVIRAYRSAVEHFIGWAAASGGRLEISKTSAHRFLNSHLAECRCAGQVQRGAVVVRSALNHLLTILGATKLASEAERPAHIEAELRQYCEYGIDTCGLAPATLISRQQWIGRFLAFQFPNVCVDLSRLAPKDVRKFFSSQCLGYRPGTAQVVACAIRSYMRFRALRHGDPTDHLLSAVPSAACWRLATLPAHLDPDELATLLAAFDRTQAQQRRDYAIVRCLVDLGLRSCEVAAITLDDVDWKTGTLAVRLGKARRSDLLPLPSITGQAIAEYLYKARPATKSRAVFVRHRAPLDLPVTSSVVRSVIRQAAARSGLATRLRGPHH
jgi:integrase/recombinase XerD